MSSPSRSYRGPISSPLLSSPFLSSPLPSLLSARWHPWRCLATLHPWHPWQVSPNIWSSPGWAHPAFGAVTWHPRRAHPTFGAAQVGFQVASTCSPLSVSWRAARSNRCQAHAGGFFHQPVQGSRCSAPNSASASTSASASAKSGQVKSSWVKLS